MLAKYKEMLNSQDQLLKKDYMLFRLLELNRQSLMKATCAHVTLKILFSCIRISVKSIYFILLTIYEYATSRMTKFSKLASMITTIWLISSWIYVVTEKSREVDENGNSVEGDFSQILYLIKNNYDTYSILCSINVLLLFTILINNFTFSSSLSMFYEVIRRCAFDAIFFILMYLNIVFVLSLIFYMLFGVTDENYKTLSDSMLNVFLISIGGKSSLNIITFNSGLKYFCSTIFMITNLLLLNMFVAIIGSHYFEYYLEQDHSKLSSLRMFANAILGNPDKYVDREKQSLLFLFRNKVFRFIHRWVNNVIEDDVQEDLGNTQKCKTCIKNMYAVEGDVLCNAPVQILNIIKEDIASEFSFIDKNIEFNWINTHFWVSNIDNYVSKLVSPHYLMTLLSNKEVLQLENERYTNLGNIELNLDGEHFDSDNHQDFITDKHVSFCIASFSEKIELWNRADIDLKVEYWKAMQHNYDVLEKQENKHSASSLSYSNECEQSYNDRSEHSRSKNDENIFDKSQEFEGAFSTPQRHFVTKCQLELWTNHTNEDAQMELWLNKFKDSNSYLRITLWNSLGFPIYYFNQVTDSCRNNKTTSLLNKNLTEMQNQTKDYNYKLLLYSCDNKELDKLSEFILKDKGQSSNEIEKLKFRRIQNLIFKQINNSCCQVGDYRTQLWLPLPVEHKLLMTISEHDKREADLMSLLIFKQYSLQTKNLKRLDDLMESSVKSLFYERYISLCQQKATEMSIIKLKTFSKSIEEENDRLESFLKFLHSKNYQICESHLKQIKIITKHKNKL